MTGRPFLFAFLGMALLVVFTDACAHRAYAKDFSVYTNDRDPDNHFIPSGWMGDVSDVKMNTHFTGNCHTYGACVQITYSSAHALDTQSAGWAGIYWQYPADNWGTMKEGYNLEGMTRLTFWARGEHGGEQIDRFQVGGIQGSYPDSTWVSIGPVILSSEWTQYSIYVGNKKLTRVIGGFGWMARADVNQKSRTFYLDQIQFEQ